MRIRIALLSFGCAKNLVDSEVMLGLLDRAGFAFVSDPDRADVVILNTCGFIRPARREAEAALRSVLRSKVRNPRRRVVVTGCYVQRSREALARDFPEVDAWLDVGQFEAIADAVRGKPAPSSKGTFLYSHLSPRVVSTPRSWAYIKVSEGCSHGCSFCAIPGIKGPYRSRPLSSIVAEARELGRRGVKEVNLVSQDTTAYARDLGLKNGLTRLLEALLGVQGIAWIRFLYGYPEEVTRPLLEIMNEPKICPYLDIPFQHADRRILRLMGRASDGARALRLVERVRAAVPGIALRTSVIVGFPGEGQAEFRRLEEFVRRAAFDHLGVFAYSGEEGTPAFKRGDTVPGGVKAARRARLMALQAGISLRHNRDRLGRRLDVLLDAVSDRDPSVALGRTRFQAPEVDGIVRVRCGRPAAGVLHGLHQVEITGAGEYDLRGKLVDEIRGQNPRDVLRPRILSGRARDAGQPGRRPHL
jgi:ribosomal protein S12 methylthiotransferase